MIENDPRVIIRNIIVEDFTHDDAAVHSGWYHEDHDGPQVSISNIHEYSVMGGNVGFTGVGPDGPVQLRAGSVFVDTWSGRARFLDEAPEKKSYEMAKEIHDIINDNWDYPEFNSLSADDVQSIPETSKEYEQRYQVTVRYTYQ